MRNFLLAFIPIFVAVDAFGVLPIYVSLTQDVARADKLKVIVQSMLTASIMSVGFIFLGKLLFKALGITIGDFMIAGGCILFAIAILDILSSDKQRRQPGTDIGVVPLGTPLIAGPAVLTTALIVVGEYGYLATITSAILNVCFAGAVFYFSDLLIRLLGSAGTKAASKITSLFLAAIAVMMVRKGIMQLLISS